jgi:hypothetical protein
MSEKKIVAWYLNVRWSEKVNNEWEEEIHEIPVGLMRQIDTFLDGVEDERNQEEPSDDKRFDDADGVVYENE